MIFKVRPTDFKNKFDIVSCFCVKDDKFLLLHRQDSKPQGNTWGIPAGKVDPGEDRLEALKREVREETGIELSLGKVQFLGQAYVRFSDFDFTFYMYKSTFDGNGDIVLSPKEHKEFRWVTVNEALQMNLIQDLDACIEEFY